MRMDAMAIAQLKRQMAWHAEEVNHLERDMQSAELALEAGKKKVDELKKKLVISKRSLDQFKIDVMKAEEELRRKASDARRR